MKIPKALEEMVAGLISDEKAEKERVEAVLSQIHELTKDFYEPEQRLEVNGLRNVLSHPEQVPDLVTVDRELESQRKLFEAKGFPTDEAERRARGILGIE
jgi:hypothetical protein